MIQYFVRCVGAFRAWSMLWVAAAALQPAMAIAQRQTADALLPNPLLLGRYGLERPWWAQATLNPARDKVEHVVVDEDTVFVHSNSGLITAFDSERGDRLWAQQLGRYDSPSLPTASNDQLAIIIVGPRMYGIAKRTGGILWEVKLPGQPSTPPSSDDEHVYVGMLDGSVYAYDLVKIRQLYRDKKLPQWSYETIAWRYKTSKEITSSPISAGRVVNFSSRDGSVYSVTAKDRRLSFQFETDRPILAPLARSNDRLTVRDDGLDRKPFTLFLASEDMTFYAVNAENGSIAWDVSPGLPIRKQPMCVGQDVFITPDRGGLHCLTVATGAARWPANPEVKDFIAASSEVVFGRDAIGNILLLSRKNGAVMGRLPLRAFNVKVTNDRTDRAYLATEAGLIICLRETGRSLPTFHKFPDRRPLSPEFTPEESAEGEPQEPAL